jgi:two-component system, LytTR family, response regulator
LERQQGHIMQNKITAVLVDDETKNREVLQNLLSSFFPEIEIAGQADSVESAYDIITLKKPQLVFLDIQMPRGNGFNLLKKFDPVPFEVIFVTSFDQYAITAIKFSALDYLLKPVEVSDLRIAIERAQNSIASKQQKTTLVLNLLNGLEAEDRERKIAVHNGDKVELLSPAIIIYIEADGSYCKITTTDKQRYTTAKFLKDFETYFGENSYFVRIHKSCLVNTTHIKSYSKGEPCFIEMSDGITFETSRRKKQEVLERLKK